MQQCPPGGIVAARRCWAIKQESKKSKTLNIQIFGGEKIGSQPRRRALLQERRVPIHFVNLQQRPMALGEIRSFIQRFGLDGLLDVAEKPRLMPG